MGRIKQYRGGLLTSVHERRASSAGSLKRLALVAKNGLNGVA